ncbi:MAG: hypothetical protein U5R48_00300 [Gammaproteobacteria bacterium]|nr:hypothetical protein [Gammaproteobacteria bacterium]
MSAWRDPSSSWRSWPSRTPTTSRVLPTTGRFRDLARRTPASLWLGIRLARVAENVDAEASYALQLRNLYPLSEEYRLYRESREGQAGIVDRESSADG